MKTFLLPLFSFFVFSSLGIASPLQPVKTDSPRDTMVTFLSAMNDYRKGVETNQPQLERRINDAIRCFAPGPSSSLIPERQMKQAAQFLKETIDRVIIIEPNLIPEDTDQKRWRLKDTEITLRPIESGDRAGEWLITFETWSRAKDFYTQVRHLDYLPNSGKGAAYERSWTESDLPEWSQESWLGLRKWQWIGLLVSLIFGFLVKTLLQAIVSLIKRFSEKRNSIWRQKILEAIENPIGLLGATLTWSFFLIALKIEGLTFTLFNAIIQITLGASLIWLCYRLISAGGSYFSMLALKTDSPLDDQLVPFAEKTLKTVIVVLGLLMILQNMGINVFSVLAGLGLGGLAFALAAKDTAANLFGSIMILVDRPFKVGDWIQVEGVDGNVEEIGFRSTRIRTFYDSLITIPNSSVAMAKIDNFGERSLRRIKTEFGLTYDTPPEKIELFVEGLKNIVLAHPQTAKEKFHVCFNSYGPASLNVLLYCFVEAETWGKELVYKQNIFLQVLELAKSLSVEFAFPTQTLHIHNLEKMAEHDSSKFEEMKMTPSEFGPDGQKSRPEGFGYFQPRA